MATSCRSLGRHARPTRRASRVIRTGSLFDRVGEGRPGGDEILGLPLSLLWILALAGAMLAALRVRAYRPLAIASLMLVVLMLVRVRSAGYEYAHHWYPVMPALATGVALGVASLWRARAANGLSRAALAGVILAFPVWQYTVQPQRQFLGAAPAERWGGEYRQAEPVAEFIRRGVKPSETVMVAGGYPSVLWLAERFAPTRWIDTPPIRWWPDYAVPERRSDLLSAPPKALVSLSGAALDPALRALLGRYRYQLAYDRARSRVWLRAG